jgi:hypothetical protein
VFVDGKTASAQGAALQGKDTGLRVTRKGKTFTFEADDGATGKNWNAFHTVEDSPYPAKLKAGVHAINTTKKEYAFKLSGLELKQGK